MGFLRTPNEAKVLPEVHQVPIALLEPSSSSDEEEEPIHLPEYQPRRAGQASRRRLVLQALQDGISCRNCKVGRRWSRRIDNSVFLQNLMKQSEDQFDDIIEQEPTVFKRLLCDKDAMQIWDSFISQPEEDQHAFLTNRIALQQAKERIVKERCNQHSLDKNKTSVGKKCFKRICPFVQEFLNSEKMPKTTLLSLEPCLINFFQAEPAGQYTTDPLGNNDRKVLHGLAQYLHLNSQSFNCEATYELRCTKVTNPKPTFTAPTVLLSEFLGLS